MKILFYNHTGKVSGAEGLLLMILSRMDRAAFEPLLVCPEQGALRKLAKDQGLQVDPINTLEARFTVRPDRLFRYCISFLSIIRQLRKRVRSFEPDLVHANSIRAGLVATAATVGMGTQVAWHLHDLLPKHPFSTVIRVCAALASRTHMIAVSDAVARNFGGRFSNLLKDRMSVILNAIDLDKFQLDSHAKRGISKELRYRETDLAVGIVGQLTPRKGQLELLYAFKQALASVPEMVLLIVGAPLFNRDQDYQKLLRKTVSDLGIADRVRMLGSRSDIGRIMQALDLLVVNSTAEPFGLVILEAMACGTPVAAAAVDGIPEIIEHNQNGYLFPPQDQEALAHAMVSCSRRPKLRAQLAAQGKLNVAARFSAERYIADLQAFYRMKAMLDSGGLSEDMITSKTGVARAA
jgi:glycosyltransferase involved in cell wall biosynthesis